MQGVCMVRLGAQHLLVAGLGLGQSSRAVVVEALLQELRGSSGRRTAGLSKPSLSKLGGSAALLAIHAHI
jgi:hypothetical protein